MGNIWQFSQLDVSKKQILQDINFFQIPDDLEDLASVLVGILESKTEE